VLKWLSENHFELICAITGIIYLYFSVKQNIWLWPLGIITSGYSVIVFFNSHLYADMSLNVYYVVVSIYGWYHWVTQKNNSNQSSLKITVLSLKGWGSYLLALIVLSLIFAWILINIPQKIGIPPSALPWLDAALTAGSIVATWMLARKVLDQWLWWIVIDFISVGMYIYKNLNYIAILFVVNTIMAVVGYLNWKKDLKKP
jgi:nicotinamide mononucleotide transporter